jgi:hypothetical protein
VRVARVVFALLAVGLVAPMIVSPVFATPPQRVPAALVGTWTAPQYKVPLSSDLDISVWGRNVFATRDVDLSVEPDGDGRLKVVQAVVDRRGRAKPYSTSVTEAHLQIREPEDAASGTQPVVTVTSAETRYLGEPEDRADMTGLVVKLSFVPGRTDALNIRFDTPQGRGSFGETIVRHSRSKPAR